MANGNEKNNTTMEREDFKISRTIDAPRELVFDVFTQPEHLMHWWGPKGLTMKTAKVDLRPGGLYHYSMEVPGGGEMWGRFLYKEIVRPERLVFINSFSDKDGGITRHPMAPNWPLEMLCDFKFTEKDGKTILELSGRPINCSEEEANTYYDNFPSMQQGFGGTFDQLDAYLSSIKK